MISRAELLELDDQRYYDAEQVLEELRRCIVPGQIKLQDLPLALGVAGSALLDRLDYGGAEALIQRGLSLSNPEDAGDLHQRLSFVWWRHLDFELALTENEKASARHEEVGCNLGVTQAMVDRGIFLGSQGLFPRSSRCFREALKSLPEASDRHRFAALHGLAINLLEVGSLHEALPHLAEAETVRFDPKACAKAQWLHGSVLSRLGRHMEGAEKLRDAVFDLMRISPIEAAMAATDMLRALLLADKPQLACQAAKEMLIFAEKLKHYRAARAAAIDLAALGARGGLTLKVVERAKERISRAFSSE